MDSDTVRRFEDTVDAVVLQPNISVDVHRRFEGGIARTH